MLISKVMQISNNRIKLDLRTPKEIFRVSMIPFKNLKLRFKTCKKVEMKLLEMDQLMQLSLKLLIINLCLAKDSKINLHLHKQVIVRQLRDKVVESTLRLLNQPLTRVKVMMPQRKCKCFLKSKSTQENKKMTSRCNPRRVNLKPCKKDHHLKTRKNLLIICCKDQRPLNNQ